MGLYVVGMHRSGTSAITELLASLPFELPPTEALVGGNESNPRGHWEVEALVDFNDGLLERTGGSWLGPATRMAEDVARLADHGTEFEHAAMEVFGKAFSTGSWLFKDPRLSLTLPFWRRLVDGNQAVLVLRDPVAIARSLQARNRFPIPFGLALWERYMRSAVGALDGMNVHVATFTGISSETRAASDLFAFAASSLDVAMPHDVGKRIQEFIDPDLRHHDRSNTPLDQLTEPQTHLVRLLASLEGSHDNFHVEIDFDESTGLDLAFTAAGGLSQAHTVAIADQRRELEDDYFEREQKWSTDFHQIQEVVAAERVGAGLQRDELLLELDRLRDIAAEGDLRLPEQLRAAAAFQRELIKVTSEFEQAASHRDFLAHELEKLQSRRAVRVGLRADSLLRKANVLPELEVAAESFPTGSDQRLTEPAMIDYEPLATAIAQGKLDRPLSVIIPVFNAVEAFQRCLESFRRWTPEEVRLVLVDDASTDERIGIVLESIAHRPNTTILRNETNRGFSGTVNRGLQAVEQATASDGLGDVVLLNSDTILTPRWSHRLRAAAHENPLIATVTPLSNAAGVFSFAGGLPTGLDEVARRSTAIARSSLRVRPTGPTGNGFCLFIKGEALDVVSRLDQEAFPRGYGEENDLCMKLDSEGWIHVVADDVAVFHEESASFGDGTRETLIEAGLKVLDERWPGYRERAYAFSTSDTLTLARDAASAAVASLDSTESIDLDRRLRTRVLVVLHDGGGGTDFHAADLWTSLLDTHEPFVMIPDGMDLVLWKVDDDGTLTEILRNTLDSSWDVRTFSDPAAIRFITEALAQHDIELVHIQHLIGHTLDLPPVARALGVPVVLSLHDFYMACPTVNLLDDKGTWCGGTCTKGNGICKAPGWVEPGMGLKHNFVHLWRHETKRVLSAVDALVTPSIDTRQHFVESFGEEMAGKLRVIEHGRDFDRPRALAHSPLPSEPVRILMVGAINEAKGAALLSDISAEASKRGAAIEVLGEIEAGYEVGIKCHGRYERDELSAALARIRPTFIGVFSVWAETHCYVVSEAWANGIPVIVGPLGAPAERVANQGGGVVVDSLDPAAFVDKAVTIARDRAGYALLAAQASLSLVRTTDEMAADYRSLYGEVIDKWKGRS